MQPTATELYEWSRTLCCDNREAMLYCDLFYKYVHGIDDLLDSSLDGRPVMSKDFILDLFFTAACLYNTTFFRQHQALLYPVILLVTNNYSDSVAWESSSKPHLRLMADVLRYSGDDVYKMVALICGGRKHMRDMGRLMLERDWLGHHDKDGNPI